MKYKEVKTGYYKNNRGYERVPCRVYNSAIQFHSVKLLKYLTTARRSVKASVGKKKSTGDVTCHKRNYTKDMMLKLNDIITTRGLEKNNNNNVYQVQKAMFSI
jgi:hypothetical protein